MFERFFANCLAIFGWQGTTKWAQEFIIVAGLGACVNIAELLENHIKLN